jgi:universal stress protein E
MKITKRILMVISGRHAEQLALQRALKFAEFDDIHIHIHIHLFNSIYEPVMELTSVVQ